MWSWGGEKNKNLSQLETFSQSHQFFARLKMTKTFSFLSSFHFTWITYQFRWLLCLTRSLFLSSRSQRRTLTELLSSLLEREKKTGSVKREREREERAFLSSLSLSVSWIHFLLVQIRPLFCSNEFLGLSERSLSPQMERPTLSFSPSLLRDTPTPMGRSFCSLKEQKVILRLLKKLVYSLEQ